MVSAGMAIVDRHGGAHAQSMLPVFEGFLANKDKGLTPVQEERCEYRRGRLKASVNIEALTLLQ